MKRLTFILIGVGMVFAFETRAQIRGIESRALIAALVKQRKVKQTNAEERFKIACGDSSFVIKDLSESDAREQFIDALMKDPSIKLSLGKKKAEKLSVAEAEAALNTACGKPKKEATAVANEPAEEIQPVSAE